MLRLGTPDFPPRHPLCDYGDAAVAPDTPFPPDLLDRLDTLDRHLAYLDRRFDDTNHRLGHTERTVVAVVDDIGLDFDAAIARSVRRQVTAVVCAALCQLVALVALMAALHWP